MDAITPRKENVCAVVVTYDPDRGFPERVARAASQAARTVVVDNNSEVAAREMIARESAALGLELVQNGDNLGVATALNEGMRRAIGLGFPWVLLLDQDSLVEPFLLEGLAGAFESFKDKDRVAVIGSNYFDEKRNRAFLPPGRKGDPAWAEAETVITSGSLVSAAAWAEIGPFRDDFFIDHVDDEYCLRALAKGFRVIICRKPAIRHSIGGAVPWKIFGRTVWSSNHARARRYYQIRNFTVLAREHLLFRPGWVLSRLVRHAGFIALMAVVEDDRLDKLRAIGSGLLDGVRGRMGKLNPSAAGPS